MCWLYGVVWVLLHDSSLDRDIARAGNQPFTCHSTQLLPVLVILILVILILVILFLVLVILFLMRIYICALWLTTAKWWAKNTIFRTFFISNPHSERHTVKDRQQVKSGKFGSNFTSSLFEGALPCLVPKTFCMPMTPQIRVLCSCARCSASVPCVLGQDPVAFLHCVLSVLWLMSHHVKLLLCLAVMYFLTMMLMFPIWLKPGCTSYNLIWCQEQVQAMAEKNSNLKGFS